MNNPRAYYLKKKGGIVISKEVRLRRITGSDQRTVIIPIDQSITSGPIPGLQNIGKTIRDIMDGKPNAMVMHRGPVMAGLWAPESSTGLIIHLSGATQLSDCPQVKACVCSVEAALQLGADAVSVHVSLGMGNERDNQALTEFGRISDQCQQWNMPLLAMMYVYGNHPDKAEAIIHAARIGCELGADLIKVNYTGDLRSFGRLIKTSYVPVVVAGGEPAGDGYGLLKQTEEALSVGAAGVCIGRNVYQHQHPTRMARALSAMVHGRCSAHDVYEEYIRPSSVVPDESKELSAGSMLGFAREPATR